MLENIDIIIVEPKIPENVGFIARLMRNFDFKNLIIVNPRCDLDKAKITATHGIDILESAKIVNEIYYDRYFLIAATSGKISEKENSLRRNYVTPEEFANFLKKIDLKKNKVGIVFGREDIGLKDEEIEKAHVLIHIPASKKFPILNLSHSVGIILYVLFRELKFKEINFLDELREEKIRAAWEYVDKIFEKFDEKGIKYKEGFKFAVKRTIYNMLIKSRINSKEISTFLGFLNKIKEVLGE